MSLKPPTDFAEAMAMFQPDKIAELFDPRNFMGAFQPPTAPGANFSKVFEANSKNFEAMVAANKAAAAAYKDFYEMQMKIFNEVMSAASQKMGTPGSLTDKDAMADQSEFFQTAVKKGVELMTELAKASQKANQDAFAVIKERLDETIAEIRKE